MSKRQFTVFLESELRKKQGELNALEGMRQNEETMLSTDEQRARELGSEQSVFFLGKKSRKMSLRDIHMRSDSVQRSIFDIRALLSEQ